MLLARGELKAKGTIILYASICATEAQFAPTHQSLPAQTGTGEVFKVIQIFLPPLEKQQQISVL